MGIYLLLYIDPNSINSTKEAIAGLSGSLFGAGSIFLGNQINHWYAGNEKQDEINKKRLALKTLMTAELVSIFMNHINNYNQFIEYKKLNENAPHSGIPFDHGFNVQIPSFLQVLTNDLLLFSPKELDAYITVYENLNKSQLLIESYKKIPNAVMTGLVATLLINNFKFDCEVCSVLINLIAPERKLKLPTGKIINFSELLDKPEEFNRR